MLLHYLAKCKKRHCGKLHRKCNINFAILSSTDMLMLLDQRIAFHSVCSKYFPSVWSCCCCVVLRYEDNAADVRCWCVFWHGYIVRSVNYKYVYTRRNWTWVGFTTCAFRCCPFASLTARRCASNWMTPIISRHLRLPVAMSSQLSILIPHLFMLCFRLSLKPNFCPKRNIGKYCPRLCDWPCILRCYC